MGARLDAYETVQIPVGGELRIEGGGGGQQGDRRQLERVGGREGGSEGGWAGWQVAAGRRAGAKEARRGRRAPLPRYPRCAYVCCA